MPRTERKRGLLSRFRRNKPPKGPPASVQIERRSVAFDKRESSPSPPVTTATRDEVHASLEQPTQPSKVDAEPRVVTPPSAKSGDQSTASSRKSKLPFRSEVILDKAPTARESAFGGPPRYDWIDIETSAAIKVQSVFRRIKAMKELEQKGHSTAAMRNRARRRAARSQVRGNSDIPSLFRCCGVGLAFGDATEESEEVERARAKEAYEARKKVREAKEAELRNNYRKVHNEKKEKQRAQEAFEVVDEEEEDVEQENEVHL